MTPKQHIHIRMSDEGRRQLDELSKRLGDTQEGVITVALDRLYRDYLITAELKEIIKNGIMVDGRFRMLELDGETEKPQEGDQNDQRK